MYVADAKWSPNGQVIAIAGQVDARFLAADPQNERIYFVSASVPNLVSSIAPDGATAEVIVERWPITTGLSFDLRSLNVFRGETSESGGEYVVIFNEASGTARFQVSGRLQRSPRADPQNIPVD